ncbi:tetratricopeptide repeat protein [Planctomyces sp. SH-PL14]|uniref:tetratricopeptide repeat protein n=1 Tax=Planctomyces sp. SH-PL14 TaxID=1632864 RepID=UPI00078D35EE|nr:hypothetical protein [Planctomyces sp. SH-PL14]AMV16290.1 Tetratricopeptide repeat protein [Planctomyces sp. SH-PL14]
MPAPNAAPAHPDSTAAAGAPAPWWTDYVLCALLALSIVLVFGQAAGFDFVNFDDHLYLDKHDHVRGGPTGENLLWGLTTLHLSNWHPLTWWSWQFDTLVWGYGPRGFHITNVLLHVLNTLLVYRLARQWTENRANAFLLALVFAVHPLRWESVGWISERKGLLSSLFALLAIDRYHAYVRSPGLARMAIVALCLTLSLMSKAMAVTLPFVLLLLDWYPYRRWKSASDLPRLIAEKWALWLLVIASCVVTYIAQKAGGSVRTLEEVPVAQRFANVGWAYMTYVVQTLWPANLCAYYPMGRPRPMEQYALAFALLLGLTVGAVLIRRRLPAVTAGWLIFLGTLVPVIGLVQVGVAAHADRYTYLPGIALLITLGTLVVKGMEHRLPQRGRRFLAAVVVVVLGIVSLRQGGTWADGRTLWTQAAAASPCESNSWQLGAFEMRARRYDAAAAAFEQACRHLPEAADLWAILATAYDNAQRGDEAEEAARHSLSLTKFVTPDSRARCELVLGKAAERRGARDEAAKRYIAGLDQAKEIDIAGELASRLVRVGGAEQAIPYLQSLCLALPGSSEFRGNLANAYAELGNWAFAAAAFEDAVKLSPDDPKMRSRWVTALLASGNKERAREEALRVVELDPKWPNAALRAASQMTAQQVSRSKLEEGYWLAGAVALVFEAPPAEALGAMANGAAGLGRLDEADALAKQAAETARANGQTDLADAIEERRAQLRTGGEAGPGREPPM